MTVRQAIRDCHLLYIISNELIEDGNKSGWVKSVLEYKASEEYIPQMLQLLTNKSPIWEYLMKSL